MFTKVFSIYIIFAIYLKVINTLPTEYIDSDFITTVNNIDKCLSDGDDEELFEHYLSIGLDDVTIKLNSFANGIEDTRLIHMLLNVPPDRFELFKRHLRDIMNYGTYINIAYVSMEGYIINWNYNHYYLENIKRFCKRVILNGNNSVIFKINKIYNYLVPLRNEAGNTLIINTILNFPEEIKIELMHKLGQSQQQIIYSLYKYILLINAKAYVLNHFAIRTSVGVENIKQKINELKINYKDNINKITRVFKFAMSSVSCDLWKDNPSEYIKGENFEDIFGLAQARILHIENLADGECNKKCEDFNDETLVNCRGDRLCERQKCKTALSCTTMESNLQICYDKRGSKRTYNYINNGNSMWGKDSNSCSETSKLSSYTRLLHGGWCPYCMCTCLKTSDFNLRPEIYINLRSVMANIYENRVVTGLRFVKYNEILYLQIQEGTLLPYGGVENVEWVPIESYNLSDRDVYRGQDYHRLSWDSRAFDLDVLQAPDEHVVTGVRFKVVQKHIKLEILTNSIDYKSGKLSLPLNTNRFTNNPEPARTEIILNEPDVSILGSHYVPNFKENQYVQFQLADFRKDAGQTVVPYFDCQPIFSTVPAALQGVGMFYREQFGYGGFISPKIITFNVLVKQIN